MVWDKRLQSEGPKRALGIPSTFQVKGQSCHQQKEAALKNQKYKTSFDLFYSFIVLKRSVRIHNLNSLKNKKL